MNTDARSNLADLLLEAERLDAVREFHRTWGDQDTDSLDVLDLVPLGGTGTD